jgi:hypothetical protein
MSNSENSTKVIILTNTFRITGNIALFAGARLTDYTSEAKSFIAVTNAEIRDHNCNHIISSSFLNVHRDHIEAIMPENLTKVD